MNIKNVSLEESFLSAIRDNMIPVSVFLVNGIKLQGILEAFDEAVLILQNSGNQMIVRHAISTVVPARPLPISFKDQERE